MRTADMPPGAADSEALRASAQMRQALDAARCPERYARIACAAAGEIVAEATDQAEARERERIVRWLKGAADVCASRLHTGQGDDTAYWADHLDALAQAADAIGRRRHARPH